MSLSAPPAKARVLTGFPLALARFASRLRVTPIQFSKAEACSRDVLAAQASAAPLEPLSSNSVPGNRFSSRGGPLFSCPFSTVNSVSNFFFEARVGAGFSLVGRKASGWWRLATAQKIRADFGIFALTAAREAIPIMLPRGVNLVREKTFASSVLGASG